MRSTRASGTSIHCPYAVSRIHRSDWQIAPMRWRCSSNGTATQPGSHVSSSTACQGNPVRAAIPAANVVFPDPVTPYTRIRSTIVRSYGAWSVVCDNPPKRRDDGWTRDAPVANESVRLRCAW